MKNKRKERRMSHNDHAEGGTALDQTKNDATSETAERAVEESHVKSINDEVDPSTIDEFPEDVAEAVAVEEPEVSDEESDVSDEELAASEEEDDVPDDPLTEDEAAAVAAAGTTREASSAMDGNGNGKDQSALERIAVLEKTIQDMQTKKKTRVASGSKSRPNVTYTLLKRPAKWDGAPQVDQLLNILFAPEVIQSAKKDPNGNPVLSEPELFKLVEEGASKGILRTRQNPVRIFQYYRSKLRKSGVDAIAWT